MMERRKYRECGRLKHPIKHKPLYRGRFMERYTVQYLVTAVDESLPAHSSIQDYFNQLFHLGSLMELDVKVEHTDEGFLVTVSSSLDLDKLPHWYRQKVHTVDGQNIQVDLLHPDVYGCQVAVTPGHVEVNVGKEVIDSITQTTAKKNKFVEGCFHMGESGFLLLKSTGLICVTWKRPHWTPYGELEWQYSAIKRLVVSLRPYTHLLPKKTLPPQQRLFDQACATASVKRLSSSAETHVTNVAIFTTVERAKCHALVTASLAEELQSKYPAVKISVDADRGSIEMRGPAGAVEDAEKYVSSCVENVSKDYIDITETQARMLEKADARRWFQNILDNEHVNCCWEMRQYGCGRRKIITTAVFKSHIKRFKQLFRFCFATATVSLDTCQAHLLQSDTWKLFLDDLKKTTDDRPAPILDVEENTIIIVDVSVNIEATLTAVIAFCDKNRVHTHKNAYQRPETDSSRLMALIKGRSVTSQPEFTVCVDIISAIVLFTIPANLTSDWQLYIKKHINNLSQESVPLTAAQTAMYQKPAARQRVQSMLDEEDVLCHWHVQDGRIVITAQDVHHKRLTQIFSSAFPESRVDVGQDKTGLVQSEEFQTVVVTLQDTEDKPMTPVIVTGAAGDCVVFVDTPGHSPTTRDAIFINERCAEGPTLRSHKERGECVSQREGEQGHTMQLHTAEMSRQTVDNLTTQTQGHTGQLHTAEMSSQTVDNLTTQTQGHTVQLQTAEMSSQTVDNLTTQTQGHTMQLQTAEMFCQTDDSHTPQKQEQMKHALTAETPSQTDDSQTDDKQEQTQVLTAETPSQTDDSQTDDKQEQTIQLLTEETSSQTDGNLAEDTVQGPDHGTVHTEDVWSQTDSSDVDDTTQQPQYGAHATQPQSRDLVVDDLDLQDHKGLSSHLRNGSNESISPRETSGDQDRSETFLKTVDESQTARSPPHQADDCSSTWPHHLSSLPLDHLLLVSTHLGVSQSTLQHLRSTCPATEDLRRALVTRITAVSDVGSLLSAVLQLCARAQAQPTIPASAAVTLTQSDDVTGQSVVSSTEEGRGAAYSGDEESRTPPFQSLNSVDTANPGCPSHSVPRECVCPPPIPPLPDEDTSSELDTAAEDSVPFPLGHSQRHGQQFEEGPATELGFQELLSFDPLTDSTWPLSPAGGAMNEVPQPLVNTESHNTATPEQGHRPWQADRQARRRVTDRPRQAGLSPATPPFEGRQDRWNAHDANTGQVGPHGRAHSRISPRERVRATPPEESDMVTEYWNMLEHTAQILMSTVRVQRRGLQGNREPAEQSRVAPQQRGRGAGGHVQGEPQRLASSAPLIIQNASDSGSSSAPSLDGDH